MTPVVLSPEAQGDSDTIIAGLARHAGLVVARSYADSFDAAYDLLASHPEIGPVRPGLGHDVRIKVVSPSVMIYAHDRARASVTILRIVHGKRRVTRRLLA